MNFRTNPARHLKIVALLVISAVVLWRLWRGLSWTEMRQSFVQANALLLIFSLCVSSATNLFRSCRWQVLLAPSVTVRMRDVFAATNIGLAGSFIFGNAAGELIRPLTLPLLNSKVRRTTAVLTIIVERVFDLSVLCMLFGFGLLRLPLLGNQFIARAHTTEIGIALLALPPLAIIVLIWFKKHLINRSNRLMEENEPQLTRGRFGRSVSRFLKQLLRALSVLTDTREFIAVTLWTAVQWLSVVLTNWLVLRAFGLPFGFKETILVMCFGLAGSFVPTPGGAAGAFHAAISGGLVLLGVALEKAAAISIAAHLVGFIPALVFGSYFLLRRGVNLAQLQREMHAVAETQ
ncbi:MAG: glycosyltransferase 2 family protein [Blastocatellia bacterium]|nr:glycosyltransferase 2 family protein [Blastocatellia bacterium]